MRTTITSDDDIAARLQRLRGEGPFKTLVNRALRLGLERIEPRGSFQVLSPNQHP